MKKQLYFIVTLLFVVVFSACETEEYTISESYALLNATSVSGPENGGPIAVPVIIGTPGGGATTISFEFSTEGFDNAAEEGVDFTLVNDSKTLTANGSALDTIWIQPVDNDVFGGDLAVNVILTSASSGYAIGDQDTCSVTIVDNEHPLAQWIGSYTVNAVSNRDPGNWDEVWNVVTSPNPGDVNQLFITGIAGSSSAIVATLDLNSNTITVAAGQNAAGGYGYDNVGIFNSPNGVDFSTDDIVGTIASDGTITFDYWAHVLTDYSNYIWDIFTPTFNKN
jgi:hypothetical protein